MPSLASLDPRFRPLAESLLREARSRDPRFVCTSALRSSQDQARLYARWLKGMNAFPALPPGRSMHERGLAVDIARRGRDPASDPELHALGAWWRARGGVWGGQVDPVHFEAPRSFTRSARR